MDTLCYACVDEQDRFSLTSFSLLSGNRGVAATRGHTFTERPSPESPNTGGFRRVGPARCAAFPWQCAIHT
jgi:hypothetical protein